MGLSQFLLRILLLLFCYFLLCGPTSSFTKQSRVLFPLAFLSSIGFLLSLCFSLLFCWPLSFTSDSGALLMSLLVTVVPVCIPNSGDCPFWDSLAAAEQLSRSLRFSLFLLLTLPLLQSGCWDFGPQASCSGSQTGPLPQPSATY